MPLNELFAVVALVWWLMLSIADVVNTFFFNCGGTKTRKSLPKLPVSYTHVPPVTHGKLSCSVPSVNQSVMTKCPLMTPALQLEYR